MKPLAERLFLKPGMAAAVIAAPEGVAADLDATRGLKVPGKGKVALDWLLVFLPDQATLRRIAGTVALALKPDAMLWFAYPTGTIRTDINRDAGWEPLTALGLGPVAAVSIDETWTALRFRPADRRGTRKDA